MPVIFNSFAFDSTEDWQWRMHARCRTEDPGLFFHPEGERGRDRRARQQRAREICAQCPVIDQCRAHSLTYREGFGTWGGLSEDERARYLRQATARAIVSTAPDPLQEPR